MYCISFQCRYIYTEVLPILRFKYQKNNNSVIIPFKEIQKTELVYPKKIGIYLPVQTDGQVMIK